MSELPHEIPIFPLTGALLLPGGRLPLHVFEPRYRNMVEDAIEGQKVIGMIQPFASRPEVYTEEGLASPDAADEIGESSEEVYRVGCAGIIEQWQRLPDGRFLVLLLGAARFRITGELPEKRGYRRVLASYEEFDVDSLDRKAELEPGPLLDALRAFSTNHGLELELERLEELPGLTLLNSIAMGLPFPPAEKQALLEAKDLAARQSMLLTLLEMGLQIPQAGTPPTLN